MGLSPTGKRRLSLRTPTADIRNVWSTAVIQRRAMRSNSRWHERQLRETCIRVALVVEAATEFFHALPERLQVFEQEVREALCIPPNLFIRRVRRLGRPMRESV